VNARTDGLVSRGSFIKYLPLRERALRHVRRALRFIFDHQHHTS